MIATNPRQLETPAQPPHVDVNPGPVFILNSEACETACRWAGSRGLALYAALASIAPPDGSRFVTSYDQLALTCGLTPRQVKAWLPRVALSGVVKIGRMSDNDLDALGFIPCRMPAIPAAAIRAARKEWRGQ